mgnify:CR=1 FL=1
MDTERFYLHALEIARMTLDTLRSQGETISAERAVRVTLQEAHTNLGQREFFAAVDGLGGHETLVKRLVATLKDLLRWPDVPTQLILEPQSGAREGREESHD